MSQFQISTQINFGNQAMDRLKCINGQRVLVVCDAFIEKSGMLNLVTEKLCNCEIHVFSEVVPDPSLELIAKGMDVFRVFKPSVLIAVGGGSAIDAAKGIYEFLLKYKGFETDLKEFIALPTTSGTGSEVTSIAVVTDTDKQVKIPLVDNMMMPTVAILDPQLTLSVPPAITADTGMDVITHGLEAIASKNASDFTDAFAEKALSLAFEFLPQAYKDGKNIYAREKMHNASCLAGIAFNQAGLGINHSLAHAIGGRWHIPHGRANAILLPYIIEFNAAIKGFRELEYSRAALCYQRVAGLIGLPAHNTTIAVNNLKKRILELNELFEIPATLSEQGVDSSELTAAIAAITNTALADVCTQTNPRDVDTTDLSDLLLKML